MVNASDSEIKPKRTPKDSLKKAADHGPSSKLGRPLTRLRLICQAGFLFLFLFLLVNTELRGNFDTLSESGTLDYPVNLFLRFDPLAAVSTSLANHSLYPSLIFSSILIVATLVFGRFFCGWICPLGTLNHWLSVISPSISKGKRIKRNRSAPYQKIKYYILIGMLAAALFTTVQTGLLDPICIMIRSVGLVVIPALDYLTRALLDSLSFTNIKILQTVADDGHTLREQILTGMTPVYEGAWFLGIFFLTILAFNRVITRFWCRGICPLGALLGVFSRFSIFGLEKASEKCTRCNLCMESCQGGDDPIGGTEWKKSECHLCLNCLGSCPEGVLRFRFFPRTDGQKAFIDLPRRRVLASVAVGSCVLPLSRVTSDFKETRNPRLIRPPGSVGEDVFLERCIKCGECMKVCPNNALQPTLFEAGLEGIWSPVLVPRIGYCEPSCVLCGQVCPTGAILPLTEKKKLGYDPTVGNSEVEERSAPVRIGTAFYDRGRCLPWAMGIPCIVCEEWCPVSPKAIVYDNAIVTDHDGMSVELKRPRVIPERCIGCGACEYACPVKDKPAVYVTRINEDRHTDSRLLLKLKR